MRRWFVLAGLQIIGIASSLAAGPIDGPRTFGLTVPAGRQGQGGDILPGRQRVQLDCRGGARACVVAVGDHKPAVEMGIAVFDEAGKKITEDAGSGEAPDFVAVIWYPPRDGKYTVEVRSKGLEHNEVTVSVK
jgi:hypothetical protein